MRASGSEIEKKENLSPGLLRQRRNLIVMSVVLILFDVSTASVAKVTLFGADIDVRSPRLLAWFAWSAWAYFLYRYLVYLRTEPDLGIKSGRYRDDRAARAIRWSKQLQSPVGDRPRNFRHVRSGWRIYYVVDYGEASRDRFDVIRVPAIRYWAWTLQSFGKQLLFTPYGTDFFLPLGVAAAAVATNLLR